MTLPTGLGGLIGFLVGVLLARCEDRFVAWRIRRRRAARVHARNAEKLIDARASLTEIARAAHDKIHVEQVAKNALRAMAIDEDEA